MEAMTFLSAGSTTSMALGKSVRTLAKPFLGKYLQSITNRYDNAPMICSCMFWTWLSPDSGDSSSNFCLLKYDDNNGVIPIPGAISGARDC